MEGGVFGFLRTAGPSLSPFNAWVILKGMETLKIRMEAHSANALQVARWLEAQPNVARVHYPGLSSHPQHELAKRQQKTGGGIVSFELKNGREAAWRVIDSVRMISITANLGDVKSTLTHPATTTHARISQESRDAAGITEGLLRIAVGLEAVKDITAESREGAFRVLVLPTDQVNCAKSIAPNQLHKINCTESVRYNLRTRKTPQKRG